jgi:hypothetical protein
MSLGEQHGRHAAGTVEAAVYIRLRCSLPCHPSLD